MREPEPFTYEWMRRAAGLEHSHEYHAERTAEPDWVRANWRFAFVLDDGVEVAEAYHCDCGSTLCVPGVGPVNKEVSHE